MGLDGIYRKTVPLNVHLIESNAGHKGVTAGETAIFPSAETDNPTRNENANRTVYTPIKSTFGTCPG